MTEKKCIENFLILCEYVLVRLKINLNLVHENKAYHAAYHTATAWKIDSQINFALPGLSQFAHTHTLTLSILRET